MCTRVGIWYVYQRSAGVRKKQIHGVLFVHRKGDVVYVQE